MIIYGLKYNLDISLVYLKLIKMDNVFEQSKEADPFGKANSQKLTNAINKFDAEVFDGRKTIHEACDFIFNQWIKTEGEAQQPRVIGARQSFVGQIDYSSVHDFLDSQLNLNKYKKIVFKNLK